MSVTDLNEYRARRAGRGRSMAAHPSGSLRQSGGERWPETDLQPFLDVIDQNIKDLARLVDPPAMQRRPGETLVGLIQRAKRPRLRRDETHHFTNNNAAWDRLMADILARGAATDAFARGYATWETPTPERRAEADRAVRILRSTDQGSNGGDAESHQGDDRRP